MGDDKILNEASQLFDQWILGSVRYHYCGGVGSGYLSMLGIKICCLTCSSIAVNLRLLVYQFGMKNGTEEKWNIMFQRYKNTSLAQEKDKLLYGLASVQNVILLSR